MGAGKLGMKRRINRRLPIGLAGGGIVTTRYDLACLLARGGQIEEGLSLLRQAVGHGLPPRIELNLEKDPRFHSLQGDPRFAALLAHAKERATAQKPCN